jgi:hypothetical protein
MNEIVLLQNQLIIMEALLRLSDNKYMIEKLREQIVFTEARIRALS